MRKFMLVAALATLTLSTWVGSAQAHLVIENFKGRAGYNEFLNLMVPHGCGSQATTEVRMKVPGSVALFAPEQKAGWETVVVMKKLDEPIRRGPMVITEVFDEVIWRGNLPANQLGVFRFLARIPDAVGTVLPFKTIQKCGDEEIRWVEVVEDGEPAWKMWVTPEPAPFVEVVQPAGPQLGATMKQLQDARQQAGAGAAGE
jgi:uncharacterized protein YcnI